MIPIPPAILAYAARIGVKGAIIGALVLALVALVAVRSCTGIREVAEQSKQDARSGEALAGAASVAVELVIERADEEATVNELVAEAIKEIENAPSDQAAGDAARAAICGLPNFSDDPACAVQPVHP